MKNSVRIASSLILHSDVHMVDQAGDNYMIMSFYSQNPSSFLGQDVIWVWVRAVHWRKMFALAGAEAFVAK